jgi:Domain of unknown function (DUF4704)
MENDYSIGEANTAHDDETTFNGAEFNSLSPSNNIARHERYPSEVNGHDDGPPDAKNGDEISRFGEDESDAYSHVDSDMIREATEAAVEDAIAMKRSDSFLSTESNEPSNHTDGDGDGGDSHSNDNDLSSPLKKTSHRSDSVRYMEDQSFEATMVSPGQHKVIQHGHVGTDDVDSSQLMSSRRQSTSSREMSETNSWSFDNLGSPFRTSERQEFRLSSQTIDESAPFLQSMVSEENRGESVAVEDETLCEGSLVELLKSCDIKVPEGPISTSRPQEVFLLHLAFKDFCRPHLSLEAVESIYMKELNGTKACVELPVDVVIDRPNPSLVKLLGTPLLSLPREWAMSLFRILLRILTNESDEEYDLAVLKRCRWYDETFGETGTNVEDMPTSSPLRNRQALSEVSVGGNVSASAKSNIYSIVRLRASWKAAVDHLLGAMDKILASGLEYLHGPATRLLGVLCSCGITVRQLRSILDLATRTDTTALTKLLLVRALRSAAAASSRSSLGKADPKSFFSFTSGIGLTRTINLEKSSWPFKNDFGMALWFRAECFEESSTLLRITTDVGDGILVTVEPLDEAASGKANASVLTVSVMEDGKAVESIKIRQGILHERVWYHVAVRHTRSRLKGVFAMGSREQLVVLLDGKIMVTDSVRFPSVKDSKSLIVTFGEKFDGQTGAIYVFNNNVSDATLKALYEKSSSTFSVSRQRRASLANGEWSSHQSDVARKCKMLDLEMRHDDLEDIVLNSRSDKEKYREVSHILDIDDDDSGQETGPLSKAAFNSRLYIAWDPTRIVGQVVLELHSGAHVRMVSGCVHEWNVDSLQDVLGSVGGIQAVLPIFHSLLAPNVTSQEIGSSSDKNDDLLQTSLLCSAVPDVVQLMSSLVRGHDQNAREMMRCGAVDMLEQMLRASKHSTWSKNFDEGVVFSIFSALHIFPSLSRFLVDAVLDLRVSCSHYIGLEIKVFAKLIFNAPLWLGETTAGVSIFTELLPVLSSISNQYPQMVRDCVGVGGIITVIVDFVEATVSEQLHHFLLKKMVEISAFVRIRRIRVLRATTLMIYLEERHVTFVGSPRRPRLRRGGTCVMFSLVCSSMSFLWALPSKNGVSLWALYQSVVKANGKRRRQRSTEGKQYVGQGSASYGTDLLFVLRH